jgi:hypothetical protein
MHVLIFSQGTLSALIALDPTYYTIESSVGAEGRSVTISLSTSVGVALLGLLGMAL